MAFSQRSIQRKRIHKLSTAAPRRGDARWLLATLLATTACAGSGAASPSLGMLALTADPPGGVGLPPGSSKLVGFILTSDRVPVAGKTVSFSIPMSEIAAAKGATLAASSAITDVRGAAHVTLVAGAEASFFVQGSYGGQTSTAAIVVNAGQLGSLHAFPYWPDSDPPADATGIEVALWSGGACADVDASRPAPAGVPSMEGLLSGSFPFDLVPTSDPIALVGRAYNASNVTVATGCVDVPAGSLVPASVVEVPLPLSSLRPDPTGTFAVTSVFTFSPPLAAAAALAAPWQDLADCPLDPAQLWLDCTIDALSGSSADDPLDCVPARAPGAEGPLGDALGAQRGVLTLDPAGVCRAGKDDLGRISLDAVALGLFGSPLPRQVVALPAIANDAAHLLDGMTLQSSLAVTPSGAPSTYVVTHTLVSARLGTSPIDVALAPFGLPVLTASATGAANDGLFTIGRHGFTLRLGTVARAAFAGGLLARGFSGDTATFVTDLYNLADPTPPPARPDGCAALDGALCPRVGYAVGCLAAACSRGLDALAARLDHGFDPANGSGLDLTLAGSAPLLFDMLGFSKVHLGLTGKNPGAWSSVELVTSAGRSTFVGTFTGLRLN